MVRSLLAVALAVLPACGGASLADFSTSQMSLEQLADGRIVVELSGPRGNCATLGTEVKATLNGRAMDVDFPGGEIASNQGWACRAPQFSLPASEAATMGEADALVVVADAGAKLVLEAQNVLAQRGLVATHFEEDGQEGHQRLTFRWIPETDSNRTASWRLQGKAGAEFGEAQVESDVVSVDLPGRAAERATLRMDGRALAPVVRCEGVAQCAARVCATSGDLDL